MDTQKAIAHVYQDDKGQWHEQLLAEHLHAVAALAGLFADKFNNGDWASLAGLWHDLGKYSVEFQNYIRNASGYMTDAHIENSKNKVDHSTAGAIHAVKQFNSYGNILAYLIAGHHAGLANWEPIEKGGSALSQRLKNNQLLDNTLTQKPPDEILNQPRPSSKPSGKFVSLWLRMLFSCLVDADFLDTEKFMTADKSAQRANYPSLNDLAQLFDDYMKKSFGKPSLPIHKIRNDILQQCRHKSELSPGLFSLSVPTGGGKTLASMAFALTHAKHYHKQRIIYVIPYTSIIEQTANIFRQVFGECVIEHHSNLDPDNETSRSRLACENWDAPIIVTTNVQFFESLFAAKTSRTRKLHNIVNSVVILDEAQLLPPEFIDPILLTMQELVDAYRVSFLLCTATQPAFEERKFLDWHLKGLQNIREIIDDKEKLHSNLKRTDVQFPIDLNKTQSWQDISTELQQYPSILCVVNKRTDCRDLYQLMPKETIHLSALMCGEHRSQVIQEIKIKLARGEPVRVISTQLVEAGVDLDFPVVYRAMAGMDSIAQAAGRCNREGKLSTGKVIVFIPPTSSPPGILRKAEQVTRQMLMRNYSDPLSPESFQHYFEQLYRSVSSLDLHEILKDLEPTKQIHIQFRTAADKFHIINDEQQANIIVLFGESNKWLQILNDKGPDHWLMRKLQRYTITIPKYLHEELVKKNDITEIYPGYFAQAYPNLYHPKIGFLGTEQNYKDPNDFVC